MVVAVVRLVGSLVEERVVQKHKPRKCSHPEWEAGEEGEKATPTTELFLTSPYFHVETWGTLFRVLNNIYGHGWHIVKGV